MMMEYDEVKELFGIPGILMFWVIFVPYVLYMLLINHLGE